MESIRKLFFRLFSPNKQDPRIENDYMNKKRVSFGPSLFNDSNNYSGNESSAPRNESTNIRTKKKASVSFGNTCSDYNNDITFGPKRTDYGLYLPSNSSGQQFQSYSRAKSPKLEDSLNMNSSQLEPGLNLSLTTPSNRKYDVMNHGMRSTVDAPSGDNSFLHTSANISGLNKNSNSTRFNNNCSLNHSVSYKTPSKTAENYHLSLIQNSPGHDILKRLNQLSEISKDQYSSIAFPRSPAQSASTRNKYVNTSSLIAGDSSARKSGSYRQKQQKFNMFSLPASNRTNLSMSQVGKAKIQNDGNGVRKTKSLALTSSKNNKSGENSCKFRTNSLFSFKTKPLSIDEYKKFKSNMDCTTSSINNQNYQGSLRASAAKNWKCLICTFINDDKLDKCDACDTSRPGKHAMEDNPPIISGFSSTVGSNSMESKKITESDGLNHRSSLESRSKNSDESTMKSASESTADTSVFKFDSSAAKKSPLFDSVFSSCKDEPFASKEAISGKIQESNSTKSPHNEKSLSGDIVNQDLKQQSNIKATGASSMFSFNSLSKTSDSKLISGADAVPQEQTAISKHTGIDSSTAQASSTTVPAVESDKPIQASSIFAQSFSNVTKSESGSFLSKHSAEKKAADASTNAKESTTDTSSSDSKKNLFSFGTQSFADTKSKSSINSPLFSKSDNLSSSESSKDQRSSNQTLFTNSFLSQKPNSNSFLNDAPATNSLFSTTTTNDSENKAGKSNFTFTNKSSSIFSSSDNSKEITTNTATKDSLFGSSQPKFEIKGASDQKVSDAFSSAPTTTPFSSILTSKKPSSTANSNQGSSLFGKISESSSLSGGSIFGTASEENKPNLASKLSPNLFSSAADSSNSNSLFSFKQTTPNLFGSNLASTQPQSDSKTSGETARPSLFGNPGASGTLFGSTTQGTMDSKNIFQQAAQQQQDSSANQSGEPGNNSFNPPTNRVIRKAVRRFG
ncbi:MAG: hypothetical protein MHMPM18_000412 [Marteilia pararefringens]